MVTALKQRVVDTAEQVGKSKGSTRLFTLRSPVSILRSFRQRNSKLRYAFWKITYSFESGVGNLFCKEKENILGFIGHI